MVGLNEIHPSVVEKLLKKLEKKNLDVGSFTSESNTFLWRTPQ